MTPPRCLHVPPPQVRSGLLTLAALLLIIGCAQGERAPSGSRKSTRRASVTVIDSFPATELSAADSQVKFCRLWVYLPASYGRAPERRYPVLYVFDGQNLFDDATSFVGEWGIDETLDSAQIDLIVVGLDHGNARRSLEYTPFRFARDTEGRETGQGVRTFDWLIARVKPHIESTYRTNGTNFIGGASLGGLMALYGEVSYPGVFSGALDFSPAYWINDPQVYQLATKAPNESRIYQLAGYREGGVAEHGSVIRDAKRMADSLTKAGVPPAQLFLVSDSLGEHNEAFWRRSFLPGVQWLLQSPPAPK